MNSKKKIISALTLVLALVFLWLFLAFFPGGSFSSSYSPGHFPFWGGKGVFGPFSPSSRVEIDKTGAILSGDPIYFSFYSARPITDLELVIEYGGELTSDKPLIELGVLADKKSGNYRLTPVENYWLEQYSDWTVHAYDNLVVFDRDNNYSSADKFFDDLENNNLVGCTLNNPAACLAVFRYDYLSPVQTQAGAVAGSATIAPLAGSHEFYTVATGQDLEVSFKVKEDNLAKDRSFSLEAYDLTGQELGKQSYLVSEQGYLEDKFILSELPSGQVVKVAIKADSNLTFESLAVNSSKFSFVNRLNLKGDSVGQQIFTDRPFVLVQGSDPLIRGTYIFGHDSFVLGSTYKQFAFQTQKTADYYPLTLAYDSLEVANNGVFAFTPEEIINPNVTKVDQYFSANANIKYIVANYRSPQRLENGHKLASVSLNMRGAYREHNRYQLVLSLPEPFAATSSSIIVYSIKGKAQATSVWEKGKQIIKKLF